MNWKTLSMIALCAVAFYSASIQIAEAARSMPDNQPANISYLASQHIPSIGDLVMARRVRDNDGEHVLVLNRKADPSPAKLKSERVEHIELDVDEPRLSNQLKQPRCNNLHFN